MNFSQRLFFAAGPGDIISAHQHWARGEQDPTEVSITFSSQMQEYCSKENSPAYFVSQKSPAAKVVDGDFILEHRPKSFRQATGLFYFLAQLVYAVSLLRTAVAFRAKVAILDSGTIPFFMSWIFTLFGIKVVTILHNTIWPSGFRPTGTRQKIVLALDGLFFKYGSFANITVSPECDRQISELTGGRQGPIYQIRAQFIADRFANIAPPPAYDGSKLGVMFIGRIDRSKGVFDIVEMAQQLEEKFPGRVSWEICGRGPNFDELKLKLAAMALPNVVLHGWVSLETLRGVYDRSHISIVPTRSTFAEGLAMTAAEAVLSGRPVLTNPTVPALEILRSACLEARTNDVQSYVQQIDNLLANPSAYKALCAACPSLQAQFYDRSRGLKAALAKALSADPAANGAGI